MRYAAFAIVLLTLPASAQTLMPGQSMMGASASSSIGGVEMPDQWGNPWVAVTADNGKALVSVFDCAGKAKIVGEVPLSSLGRANNFNGFKPYVNATMQDLAAVSEQSAFEKNCWSETEARQACEPNPRRHDCRAVEVPTTGFGMTIPTDAWHAYEAMHPKRGAP